MLLSIAVYLRFLIKYSVVFMTVVHSYLYLVVHTQRGCHNLKLQFFFKFYLNNIFYIDLPLIF